MCTRSFCDQFMVVVRSLSTMDECTFNGSVRWSRPTASPHFPPAPQISFCFCSLYLLREISCLFSTVFGIMAVSSTAQRSRQPLLPRPSIFVHSDFPKYLLSIVCHFQKLDRIADHSVWPSASPIPIPSLLQILPTLFKSPCVPRLEDAVHAPGDSPRCSQGWWPVSCVADEGRRATRP
jgi:hypothetical protein